jgi:hypothetical protein
MQDIQEAISVIFVYNAKKRYAKPHSIKWRERNYKVEEICMHYFQEKDGTFWHTYVVQSGSTVMQVAMNARTLFWELEKVGSID